MVWPAAGSPASNPARAAASTSRLSGGGSTIGAPERRRKKARKSGIGSMFRSSTLRSRIAMESEAGSSWLNRSVIETALLVLGLVLIGGFIGYWVWPPSAQYLYRQAEGLMASSRRSDWRTALEEYIVPLDERFPQHPYREQTAAWRDQIMLEEVDGRATILGNKVKTAFSEPKDRSEELFVIANAVATDASERGDDFAAIRKWEEFANQVKPDDPNQRKWYLLARKRMASIENEIRRRRELVEKQLIAVVEAYKSGRANEAEIIKKKLVEQYGKYSDLADLLGLPPAEAGVDSKLKSPAVVPPHEPAPEAATAPEPAKPARSDEGQANSDNS
jgi:eukaryotic-like serine/threonine-protein kinase